MGLEEEFGLFKRKGMGMGLITGRPKRKLRRIVTRPIGFLTKPVSRVIRKKTSSFLSRKTKKFFEDPPRKLSTMEILEQEQKFILKKLKKRKALKTRAKKISALQKEFR